MQLKKVNLIEPSLYQHTLAELFVKEVYSSNEKLYKDRNPASKIKIKSDIYLGKMAEFAVWNFLISQSKSSTFPDVGVYPQHLKSYDADIISADNRIHVKSCMNGGSYPNSWVFQPNDKLCTSPSDKDFVALVVCYPSKKFEAYFVSAKNITELYRPPVKQGVDKKVIYEEDLMSLEV